MSTAALENSTPQNAAALVEQPTEAAPRLVKESVTRLRPYVPGKPIDEVKRELGLPDDFTIYKLASNENVLGPSPKALEAMRQAGPDIWLYPDDTCFNLKNELAKFWDIAPEHFIIGNGSDEIIHFLSLALLDVGDEVIFGAPSFVQYKSAAMLADCAYHAVPLTADYRHDLPAMRAKVNENTKLIFIANPNNPTGTVITRRELEGLLADLPPRVVVVLDQAYFEYVEDAHSPEGLDFVREGHNVVLLHTFSKAYALAGLRVGYGIARPELTGYLQQVRGPFNVNSLAQAAAIASLNDDQQVASAQKVNQAGKAQFYAGFDSMGLTFIPTEANFVLVDCERDSRQVFTELLRHGVIVRTGDPFGMPTWIRVTIGTSEMNERFISALRTVLNR